MQARREKLFQEELMHLSKPSKVFSSDMNVHSLPSAHDTLMNTAIVESKESTGDIGF